MKHLQLFEDFIYEDENMQDYLDYADALHLYDTHSLDSDIGSLDKEFDEKGVKTTADQERELNKIFSGSKVSSSFIFRASSGRWKNATEKKYAEDCKTFGKAKVDAIVQKVLSVFK
jgi:hypothetical protein